MDAIPEGEGCGLEAIAIGLIALGFIVLILPGLSWMVKLGLGFVISIILIGVLAGHLWNNQ